MRECAILDLIAGWLKRKAYGTFNIPEIKINFVCTPVTASTRRLKAQWSPLLPQDLAGWCDEAE